MRKWMGALIVAVACAAAQAEETNTAPAAGGEGNGMPQVQLTTSMGSIVIKLNPDAAPKTVENFLAYVEDDHYDGTIFHRVIDGFMIQGGGFTEAFRQKPTKDPVPNEAHNGLKNQKGTVAMARTSDVDSATAQFFINVSDNAFLDHRSKTPQGYGYCVFGKVVDGMEVVDKIRAVQTGSRGPYQDVPVEPVLIESAERLVKDSE
jgi:cyclophilin family peptidyl-prolyl cis-trans isomerase